jgi:hypothetical protein
VGLCHAALWTSVGGISVRIGLITTIDTNVGDDFIREGICLVLQEVFKGHEIEFVPVNKHQPLTVYPDWHPIHSAKVTRYLPKGRYWASRLIDKRDKVSRI